MNGSSLFTVKKISSKLYTAKESSIKSRKDYWKKKLEEKDYDSIGIANDNGVVNSYMTRDGNISNIPITSLVSNELGIDSILARIKGTNPLYVLTENGIDRIITQADLDKPAYKTYMFMLYCNYELLLADKIIKNWNRKVLENTEHISIQTAENKALKNVKSNTNLDITYYLLFSEKIYALKSLLSERSNRYMIEENNIQNIINLRNDIAHGRSVYNKINIDQLYEIEQFLKKVVNKK